MLPPAAAAGWRARAACLAAGVDPEWFFPERGERARGVRAKTVCAGCAVRPACLADALATPSSRDFGVRGGLTAGERRRLRRGGASR